MSGSLTLATLTGRDALAARGRRKPTTARHGAGEMDSGEARTVASVGMVERCRRAEDLLARWVALAGRPGDDLDPDSPKGAEALAFREDLETELRWLEANAARTAAEAKAKLAFALTLAALAGEADARYLAFLVRARAERAGLAERALPRSPLLSARGLFGAVGLRR